MSSKRIVKEPMPEWGHELVETYNGHVAPMKDICQLCEEDVENWTLLACDKCDFWFHIECLKISKEETKRILNYFCNYCCKKYDLLTEWRKSKPSKMKKLDKEKNYFEVNEIISCRGQVPNREFYVSWKDYGPEENCWVLEKDMDGSIDLMQEFLLEHHEPLSTITGIMGATKKHTVNKSNWLSMDKLLQEFAKYKERYVNYSKLNFEEFENLKEEDGLYFMKWESHCYVLLHIFQKNLIYLADGVNLFREDSRVSQEIQEFLKIRIISCKFEQQTKADYCVSSAIVIGLEMIKSYESALPPLVIRSPKVVYKRLCNILHKHESTTIKSNNLTAGRVISICRQCGKKFNTSKGCRTHERFCN